MFKKLITFMLAVVVGVQPITANAANLGEAFSNLLGSGGAATTSGSGRFQAGARNIFVAGGAEVRFPRSSATLFSITPPSISAGCQGISAHFGGFSFISGAQIEQLVKNIAQGAPGLVINLVIKTLCPMCEAVLQNMQKLAQFAAKTNMDSCRLASSLVDKLGKSLRPTDAGGTDAVTSVCNSKGAAFNAASDWGAAQSSICDSMTSAVSSLEGWWKKAEDGLYGNQGPGGGGPARKQNTDAERCGIGLGNCSYLVLKQIFPTGSVPAEAYAKRLLLMNLMGTTLMGQGARCSSSAGDTGETTTNSEGTPVANDEAPLSVKCLPKIEPREVIGLFMCGSPGSIQQESASRSQSWQSYCGALFSKQAAGGGGPAAVAASIGKLPVMDCRNIPGRAGNPYDKCESLETVPLETVESLNLGNGFLLETEDLLYEAVSRVRNNQPIGGDEKGRKIIALVSVAPYPLYQAINAAAVYPEAGTQLMDSLAILVADHIAYSYFQRFLSLTAESNVAGLTLAPDMVDRLVSGMNALRMEIDVNRARIGRTIASQQMVMEEIRKINTVIQQQVMTDQMLNMQKYANTINTQTSEPSMSGK